MAPYWAVLAVFVAGFVAMLALRHAGDLLQPPRGTAPGRVPYAGGLAPDTHAWNRYHVRWYAMALLFLAFDMEMVYMYPWAVVFVEEGLIALVEMGIFIGILLLGILYAWREGALRWA
ncbi:MAG: NADH-quinone oxidoreductase subunit A [Actinomycetota bacterium]|nr:NADH-quinone oxidoreductase subunit A [Actinomycetota bacterium]